MYDGGTLSVCMVRRFPDKYLSVLVRTGYNTTSSLPGAPWPFAADMQELMRRASWTHLVMQSPWGEVSNTIW